MAGQQSPPAPWTLAEKNILLTEIIKTHSPQPGTLMNVINATGMQPDWHNTPLPPGRSLNECMWTFDEMRRTNPQQGYLPAGMPTPSPMSAPLTSAKRPFFPDSGYPGAREIRPKPLSTGQPALIENPPKKRRGRKPKAETLAKAVGQTPVNMPGPSFQGPMSQQALMPGTAPLPETAITSPFISGPSTYPFADSTAGARTPLPEPRTQISRMPISSMITPDVPKSASHSSSSSGKRRRARSTRSESGDLTSTTETSGPVRSRAPGDEAESPSLRMMGEPPGTPARAAMMRHRDEMEMDPTGTAPGARESFQRPSTQ